MTNPDCEYIEFRNKIIKSYANRKGESKREFCREHGITEFQLNALLMQTGMNISKVAKACVSKFKWTYDPKAPEFNRPVRSNFSDECIPMLEAEAGISSSASKVRNKHNSRFTIEKFNFLLKIIYMSYSVKNEAVLQRLIDVSNDIAMEVEA